MPKLCECNTALGNTGRYGCVTVMDVARKLILVPLYDKEGNKNAINIDTDFKNGQLPSSFVEGKINEADGFKRWYPLGDFDNVLQEQAEPVSFTTESGDIYKIKDAPKTFTGIVLGVEKSYLKKLYSASCVRFGVYVIDVDGNIEGTASKDGKKLYPTAVSQGSWDARYKEKTNTEPAWANVKFYFDQKEQDAYRRMISATDIEEDMLSIEGLKDAYFDIEVVSATQVKVTTYTDFGPISNPIRLQGLTGTEIKLKEGATDLTTVIDEETPGVYTIDIDAQTTGDIISVSINQNGFYATNQTFTAL